MFLRCIHDTHNRWRKVGPCTYLLADGKKWHAPSRLNAIHLLHLTHPGVSQGIYQSIAFQILNQTAPTLTLWALTLLLLVWDDLRVGLRTMWLKKEQERSLLKSFWMLLIFKCLHFALFSLLFHYELWVVTERMRSRIQAAEMSFLPRVAGLSRRDRVRSSDIRRELRVELLLLRFERSQLRWLGHLIRMPPGCLPLEVFWARPTGRRPWGKPRIHWRDYISHLAWERLAIPQEELESLAGCHRNPAPDKRMRIDGFIIIFTYTNEIVIVWMFIITLEVLRLCTTVITIFYLPINRNFCYILLCTVIDALVSLLRKGEYVVFYIRQQVVTVYCCVCVKLLHIDIWE